MSTPLPTEDEFNRFLEENNVNNKWREIFHSDIDIKNSLFNIINITKDKDGEFVVPTKHKILRAFSRCAPEDIKVVILGHSPIPDKDLASGFSFSFPEGSWAPAPSIARLRNVLVEVGFLESVSIHDYCHEEWADKGVLLLNASLTLLNDTTGGQKAISYHFPLWETFIKHVLLHVAGRSHQNPVFFLCWGTDAQIVGNWLSDKLIGDRIHKFSRFVIYISHHPTYPREDSMYHEQAVNQFRRIKCFYPDLFTLSETEHMAY